MAAKTPVRLYNSTPAGVCLYRVPGVTTSDTADIGSTGTNDFTKVFLAVLIPLTNSALGPTTLTNATNLTLSASALTGEDCLLLVVGAAT